MKVMRKAVMVLGVVALCASPAMAQQRGGFGQFGMGGGMGGTAMLNNEGVQKELKMTEEQVTKVREIGREIREKHMDDFAKLRELSQEERGEKMRELTKTIAEETKKALGEVMKPEQTKRFRQIELQNLGLAAFVDPEVVEKLKLNDDQKKTIKELSDDAAQEMRGLFQPGGGGGPEAMQEMMKKMAAMRKETTAKGMSLLTADQKATWKTMTGDAFEVKMEAGQFGQGKRKKKDK